jgi:guanylate kinase
MYEKMEKTFRDIFGRVLFLEIPGIHLIREFTVRPGKELILLVFGPSGAGKDTVIGPLIKDETLYHVVTATTRRRRYEISSSAQSETRDKIALNLSCLSYPEYLNELDKLHDLGLIAAEPRDAYVWLPQYDRKIYRSRKKYVSCLVAEYNLVEYDIHHNNLYGLPRASILKAAAHGGVPVIRTDNSGVRTLLQKLSDYNPVAIAVLPDSFADIVDRIEARPQAGNENVEVRIADSARWVGEIEELAHLVLHNTRECCGGVAGAERSVESLRKVIKYLSGI